MHKDLLEELKYLSKYEKKAILVNTTARDPIPFRILPRRLTFNIAISSFMINNVEKLVDTLTFFDGKVDYIFIDVELKQEINLFLIAKQYIKKSRLIAIKPNDTTIESCDILIRNHFKDDLYKKNILIIGTGNLASKIALRMCERQANVFIKGRNKSKEQIIVNGLNSIIPRYASKIKSFSDIELTTQIDVIISFISGEFREESMLYPLINTNTFIVDGGINNFSGEFIKKMLSKNIEIIRLDTRIALPYQMLSILDYTNVFFKDIYGKAYLNGVGIVSGGVIGKEGSVIVDNINNPSQIIGIANGSGGVKKNGQLSQADKANIKKIRKAISVNN